MNILIKAYLFLVVLAVIVVMGLYKIVGTKATIVVFFVALYTGIIIIGRDLISTRKKGGSK